ncbi:hypothetical protein COOONC_11060 [Cooperia oncophora]
MRFIYSANKLGRGRFKKRLFPKENIEFAESVDADDATILKEVFVKHSTFNEIGEMIEAVEAKSPQLGKRMRALLAGNCSRLDGLSPTAIDYSKKVITFVTSVMCRLTLGEQVSFDEAEDLHQAFQELSSQDQASLQKANPDLQF